MAGFDTRNALNLAIRALKDAALERNRGGWIPPKEAERQQKEAMRAEEKEKRETERKEKEQKRDYEKSQKLLSKQFPTQYMPNVGRQVMQSGGTPDEDLVGYHGSGDVFEKFDPMLAGSSTGTEYGEAAAYISKEEPVAQEYRDRAARRKGIMFQGQPLRQAESAGPEMDAARSEVADRIRDGYEPHEAIQKRADHWLYFANRHKEMAEKEPENQEQHMKDAQAFEDRARLLLSLDPNDFERPKGHMYQVKVMAHPEHFLDWNKPFAEQSDHVREALTPTVEKINELYNEPKRRRGEMISKYDQPQNMTGEKIYRFIQKHSKGDWSKPANPIMSGSQDHKYSTKYLKDLGIRGVTYLDTVWNAANPPRNYAVYNPEDLEILKRYARGGSIHVNNVSRPKFALGGTNAADETITSRLGQAPTEAGEIPFSGRVGRSDGNVPASNPTPSEEALQGLPSKVKIPKTGETLMVGPDPRIRQVARDYMAETGMPYNPPKKYANVDPNRAKRIAQAFEEMPHDPEHPLVRSSYDALIKETMAQYNAAKKAGFKAEFWNPETDADPYEASPRLATEDIRKNHHMYVFPTRFGYGSGEPITEEEIRQNPMLQDSGETWNGQPVTVNDIFRAVHDYYGHAKEGVGFRHDGEENAWRAHASMFSPLARLAMTTETRGQNNWLNFGPHGEANQKARTEDTVFADQKIGILPTWVHHEGAEDFMQPEDVDQMKNIYDQYSQKQGMARGGAVGYADGGSPSISDKILQYAETLPTAEENIETLKQLGRNVGEGAANLGKRIYSGFEKIADQALERSPPPTVRAGEREVYVEPKREEPRYVAPDQSGDKWTRKQIEDYYAKKQANLYGDEKPAPTRAPMRERLERQTNVNQPVVLPERKGFEWPQVYKDIMSDEPQMEWTKGMKPREQEPVPVQKSEGSIFSSGSGRGTSESGPLEVSVTKTMVEPKDVYLGTGDTPNPFHLSQTMAAPAPEYEGQIVPIPDTPKERMSEYHLGRVIVPLTELRHRDGYKAKEGLQEYNPPTSEAGERFPTQQDVDFYRSADAYYGRPEAGYIQEGARGSFYDDLSRMTDRQGGYRRDLTPQESDAFMAAYMAAQRNPIAALGFRPEEFDFSGSPYPQTTAGMVSPTSSRIYTDLKFPSVAVHESVHRGLTELANADKNAMLQKQDALINEMTALAQQPNSDTKRFLQIGDELRDLRENYKDADIFEPGSLLTPEKKDEQEMFVRALVHKMFGPIDEYENTRQGFKSDVAEGYPSEDLEKFMVQNADRINRLEQRALQMLQQRQRAGGPRASGGAVRSGYAVGGNPADLAGGGYGTGNIGGGSSISSGSMADARAADRASVSGYSSDTGGGGSSWSGGGGGRDSSSSRDSRPSIDRSTSGGGRDSGVGGIGIPSGPAAFGRPEGGASAGLGFDPNSGSAAGEMAPIAGGFRNMALGSNIGAEMLEDALKGGNSQPARPITPTPFSSFPRDVQNAMIPERSDASFGQTLIDPSGKYTQQALDQMKVATDATTMLNSPTLAGAFVRMVAGTPTPATPEQQAAIERMYRRDLNTSVPANFATPEGMAQRYGAPGATPLAHPGQTSTAYLSAGPSASTGRQDLPIGATSSGQSSPPQTGMSVRDNFNKAFSEAMSRKEPTFVWTNPVTGQSATYRTILGRKDGGRIPSMDTPEEWLADQNESKKKAVKKKNKPASKAERNPIVNRALMVSSRKS